MNIIISPFSRILPGVQPNAKNYPYWSHVVSMLRSRGYRVIQVGVKGDPEIGANGTAFNLSFDRLKNLLDDSVTWLSVDNFFNHFANYHGRKGVVIFGVSDPNIFGYEGNINLLKHRKYLRQDQFGLWPGFPYSDAVFLSPHEVVEAAVRWAGQDSVPLNGITPPY